MPQAPQIDPVSQIPSRSSPARRTQRLAPHFQRVPLVFREILYEAGDKWI